MLGYGPNNFDALALSGTDLVLVNVRLQLVTALALAGAVLSVLLG